jgi:hypothetical protein
MASNYAEIMTHNPFRTAISIAQIGAQEITPYIYHSEGVASKMSKCLGPQAAAAANPLACGSKPLRSG